MPVDESQDLYQDAGVDIKKGDQLVKWLQSQETPSQPNNGTRPHFGVLGGIGGFAGLFRPDFAGMQDPLLVAATDGVGTKVLLGIENRQISGLGVDLVAMCVNDLYTIGAKPLFFLDYYATGALLPSDFKQVLSGIQAGLGSAQCALLGGETAELPGLYTKGHFDLAGFVVGVVDKDAMLTPQAVRPHDHLIALGSSGFHANGYSLIRKWYSQNPQPDYLEHLLKPTKIYFELPNLVNQFAKKGLKTLAHITGGGISGNLPRVMPDNVRCAVEWSKIPTPQWMRRFITDNGASLSQVEHVFNLGCGMIACVDPHISQDFVAACLEQSLDAHVIGVVESAKGKPCVAFH